MEAIDIETEINIEEKLKELRKIRALRLQKANNENKVTQDEKIIDIKQHNTKPGFEIEQAYPIQKNKEQKHEQKNTLIDLINFYKNNGLVGEEKTAILQTLGAIHGLCFGIESLSGSGKSFTLDILLDLLPKESVYILPQSSDKALMYDSEKVNNSKVIVVTELQKSANNKTIIEILKDLGEGKNAERKVTKTDRSGIEEQKIESGKSIIYTLALENWFKKDREFERRYFQLYTDISKEQTLKILENTAQREFLGEEKLETISKNKVQNLKNHIKDCLELPNFRYINPFSEAVILNMPPNIKARSFIKHYLNLIQASAKFHYKSRFILEDKLFVNLEDIYFVNQLYQEQFLKSVLRIPIAGEELLSLFDNQYDYISSSEIHKKLKRDGSPLTFPIVTDMLEELVEAGYLEKNNYNSKESNYKKISEIKELNNYTNWQNIWENGLNRLEENYKEYVNSFIDYQVKQERISVINPLKNKEVILTNEIKKDRI